MYATEAEGEQKFPVQPCCPEEEASPRQAKSHSALRQQACPERQHCLQTHSHLQYQDQRQVKLRFRQG